MKGIVPVAVEKATADIPVNFTREIEPILTKAGCNSGACHGAQHGKGGFRLSLFGFDAAGARPTEFRHHTGIAARFKPAMSPTRETGRSED